MQEILDRYKTGILISKVTMQNAQPPEQVQAAFDDAVKAGQDRERQKNEGQAYANDVVPKARGTAARLLQEADGYKQRVIATAEGDAARFRQIQTEYAKAPEVTRNRMYLETMQQVYSNATKILVDTKSQGNLLYLPLDKLIQAASAGVASESVGSSAEMPAPTRGAVSDTPPLVVDKSDTRSRDALRSRDREGR
jgi:membrane protease subunit HflK